MIELHYPLTAWPPLATNRDLNLSTITIDDLENQIVPNVKKNLKSLKTAVIEMFYELPQPCEALIIH